MSHMHQHRVGEGKQGCGLGGGISYQLKTGAPQSQFYNSRQLRLTSASWK